MLGEEPRAKYVKLGPSFDRSSRGDWQSGKPMNWLRIIINTPACFPCAAVTKKQCYKSGCRGYRQRTEEEVPVEVEEKEAEAEENKENENGEESAEKEKENIGRQCGKMIDKKCRIWGKISQISCQAKSAKMAQF